MKQDLLRSLEQALPDGLRRVLQAAETGARAAQVLHRTGLLGAMSARGIGQMARASAGRLGARGKPGVQQMLRFHAYNTPDKIAVVFGPDRFTYREFDQRICRLAHALARRGVGPGAAVAVMLRNCHEYLETQFAISHLGATCVQVGYRLKAPEVGYILENSQSRAVICGAEFAETVAEAARSAPALAPEARIVLGSHPGFQSYEDLLEESGPVDGPPPLADASLGGLMVYTSGTTGKPKGALRDFKRTGLRPVLSFLAQLPISHEDRHLVCCPLYHSAAPAFAIFTFLVGGTVVLLEHFEPEEVLRTIEFERVTSAMMVPTMYSRLVHLPREVLRRYDTSSLRWLISGAAPLPTALAARIEATFGPILYNFYGATETGLVTLAKPGEHTSRPGTIGRLLEGNEVRLLDDAGACVPEGEVGELWVRNDMLVEGYHRNQEATSKSLRDGFFTVGDLARRDADGYYYLADRKIDMVISGGVNIYPLEIEDHLHTHPAVLDCAIVGLPDEEWGEALCAFVVKRPGHELDAEAVRSFVGQSMADYKKPKHVVFVDTLPRNPTGKVLKRELRELGQTRLAVPAAPAPAP